MKVQAISAFTDNYIWVLIDEQAGVCDCVDPGEAKPLLDWLKKNNLSLRAILLTHHHADHIGGVHELAQAYPNCTVYGPEDSRIPRVDAVVHAQDTIDLKPFHFKVLSNPGHTSSHISYFETNQKWLFCGDTLFSAGCGRVFDGTMEQLHASMQLFKQLPPDTKVFCGHEYTEQNLRFAHSVEPDNQDIKDYLHQLEKEPKKCTLPSTISLELLINPFFRTECETVKKYALSHGARSADSLNVFESVRNQKNVF
ncbi:MAG: hydroxyacylglutathione hydrolase [Legionella sp.]|jgi:hydroxyacylglutathione hydrolase